MNFSSRKGQAGIVIAVLIALGILVLAGTDIGQRDKRLSTGDSSSDLGGIQLEEDTPPLPEGEDTYSISSGVPGPQAYEFTINPLGGAAPGVLQNLIVKARYEVPIDTVVVTMIMDNGSYPISLALVEGTELDGVWNGSWEVSDTHNAIYQGKIEAEGAGVSSEIVLTFQPLP